MHPFDRVLLLLVLGLQLPELLFHLPDDGDQVCNDLAGVVLAVRLQQAGYQRTLLDELAGQKLVPLGAVSVQEVLVTHVQGRHFSGAPGAYGVAAELVKCIEAALRAIMYGQFSHGSSSFLCILKGKFILH